MHEERMIKDRDPKPKSGAVTADAAARAEPR
jgi:hypothetical protein